MINKKDFISCMRKIQKSQKMLEKFMDDIGKYFDDVYSFSLGDELLYSQIEILKITMNDTDDSSWIDWFIYENDWGREKYKTGQIRDLHDLYNLLKSKTEKEK